MASLPIILTYLTLCVVSNFFVSVTCNNHTSSNIGVKLIAVPSNTNNLVHFASSISPRGDDIDVTLTTKHTFTVGHRVNGDRLLDEYVHNLLETGSEQDVKTEMKYPNMFPMSVIGVKITYVEVIVEHSSNSTGIAYVTDGGIGQNKITFCIEVKQTKVFRADVKIYGH
ncbi:uncharacterized protein LOC116338152 [Contarinia nasturtii]|uniref:uncharacterized protein LOC116338152 n=1 Tax=Contarinia nasturtii TaxID=265458 RepID=UPI0012D39CA0|nr:uncharacterized protein LOC116338152 [Contarinia nasturtii]